MSHRHTVIEPAAGLTVLVGPNNCGKSAIVTALQILCHNDNSTYVLRHGAKECRIIVETDDDHRIEWSRKKSGSPSYRIDGQEFDRLRGESGVWEQLKSKLRLPRIDCDKNQFDVHFGEQRNPVFLLEDKGKGAAQFFASSSDAIRLVEMQDLHKSQVRDRKKEHARLLQEQIQVEDAIHSIEPVETMSTQLAHCEDQLTHLQQNVNRAESLQNSLSELSGLLGEQNRLRSQSRILDQLASPPEFHNVSVLQRCISSLDQTRASIARSNASHKALVSLDEPPAMADESRLARSIDTLRAESKATRRLRHQQQSLQQLTQPPTDNMERIDALCEIIDRLQVARESCVQAQQLAATVNRQVCEAENEIEEWVSQNPSCPTCGSEVSKELLLGGGGHHHA